MIVFYTASFYGKDKYQKYYDLVRKTIESFKVQLISPESMEQFQKGIEEGAKKLKTEAGFLKYETIRAGIHKADAVVIEVSNQDFQLGHEATLAIMEKKPVLCLSLYEDLSKKINHEYFFGAKYDEKTISGIVQDFFAHARDLSLSKRFNLFLSPYQVEYLERMSKKFGINMSEYIRRLINLDRRSLLKDYQESAWPKVEEE